MGYLDKDGLSRAFTKLKTLIDKKVDVDRLDPVTTSGTSSAYTATVPGITALTSGARFIMLPHVQSTVVNPTLNVNGLGAKLLRVQCSNSSSTAVPAPYENFLGANKPVEVMYNGIMWVAQIVRPEAGSIYGTVKIENGGTGADSINGIRTNIGINAVTTGGTGAAYTASVGGLTLVAGASFVMVPHVVSTTATPTLNVNDLGAKNIRMRISSSTVATTALPSVSFLAANKPVRMMYDGAQWVIDDMVRPDANNLYGTIISRGTAAPTSSTEGYIYIQTT